MKINDTVKFEAYKKEISIKTTKVESQSVVKKEDTQVKSPNTVEDKVDIELLKEESEKAYSHLRQIVEDLLKRQGYNIEQLGELKAEDIKVDQKARDEAKQMIEEGGPLSPEAVSDRIVDFAKAISSGDKSKFDLISDAIEEGFDQAKEMMGGELPDISQETYDLIQEKMNAWKEEE